MTEQLPRQSAQVRSVPFLDGLLLHDELSLHIHVLNGPGAVIWEACDGTETVADLVADLAEATGIDASTLAVDVRSHVEQLASVGLVGRAPQPATLRLPAADQIEGPLSCTTLRVLDTGVAVRTNDPAMVDHIARAFGSLEDSTVEATVDLGVHVGDDGSFRLHGQGYDELLAGLDALDERLSALLNRVATTADAPLAFHAGAVRSPLGSVVVVAGESGSGKSTMTGALLLDGWSYLTDEAVGVRPGSLAAVAYPKPLSLDATSQAALGLALGAPTVTLDRLGGPVAPRGTSQPVTAIALARYEPGAALMVSRLEPVDAVAALAGCALNLVWTGLEGLQTLAALASEVPVVRLVHGGGPAAIAAIDRLAGGDLSGMGEDLSET